jgi:hypothetical protein
MPGEGGAGEGGAGEEGSSVLAGKIQALVDKMADLIRSGSSGSSQDEAGGAANQHQMANTWIWLDLGPAVSCELQGHRATYR